MPSVAIPDLIGWIPAVIFPFATGLQLARVVVSKSSAGVSVLSWLFFGVANISVYIYSEKYGHLQSIIGFLLTAVLDFVIVALVLSRRKTTSKVA